MVNQGISAKPWQRSTPNENMEIALTQNTLKITLTSYIGGHGHTLYLLHCYETHERAKDQHKSH